jgi:hypothetical protein
MALSGYKEFSTGEVLTAANVNNHLMQVINVYADATARDAGITSSKREEGQFVFLKDSNTLQFYDGSSFVDFIGEGDITGVTITTASNSGLAGGAASTSGAFSSTLTADLNNLTAATVSVANDSIAIVDADDSNATKKESIADLVSGFTGANLTATSGVIALDIDAEVDFNDQTAKEIVLKDYAETDVAVSSGTTLAIDLANGNTGSVTLGHNVTDIDFTNVPTNGTSTFTLKVTQDGTGNRTMAINAITVNGGSNVTALTVGNAGLTLSTAAASVDLLTFLFFDASTPLLNALLDFKNS